ncbi:Retrovirus-related Pol poly from transposon, partial [Brachionus plicatilis]
MKWKKKNFTFSSVKNIISGDEENERTDDKRKVAALFHHAGREISRIYKSMSPNELVDNMPRVDKFEDIKKKINDYLNLKKNVFYEIHKFKQAKQESGESIAGYVTRFKNLSTYCGFTNVDNEIISQIIEGSNNRDVVAKALRTLLDWGRTREVAGQQIKDIEKDSNEVNAVHNARRETRTGKEHGMSVEMFNSCFASIASSSLCGAHDSAKFIFDGFKELKLNNCFLTPGFSFHEFSIDEIKEALNELPASSSPGYI